MIKTGCQFTVLQAPEGLQGDPFSRTYWRKLPVVISGLGLDWPAFDPAREWEVELVLGVVLRARNICG